MSNENSKEVNEVNETILNLPFYSSFYESKNKEPTYDYYIKRNSRIIKILWCVLYFAAFSILTDGDLKQCVSDGMWIITIHGFLFFFAFCQSLFSPNPIKNDLRTFSVSNSDQHRSPFFGKRRSRSTKVSSFEAEPGNRFPEC